MQPCERLGSRGRGEEIEYTMVGGGDFQCFKKRFYGFNANQQAMKQKKCCYMDRDCTPACVAYSSASELSESLKELGMNSMQCMRLILDLTDLMRAMNSEDFEDEETL